MKSAYFSTGEILTANTQAQLNRIVKLHRNYLNSIGVTSKVWFKECDAWCKAYTKFDSKSYNVSFSL